MKKIMIILLVIIPLTACTKEEKNNISTEKIHEHCTRNATAGAGIDVNLSYEIYYSGEVLNKIESTEQIITENQDKLTEYENAYKSIHSNYKNLQYYETSVKRENNKVTSYMKIEYDKLDIKKLIEIEGEEDNIFENNVPKVDKWKELAKKVGTKCSILE